MSRRRNRQGKYTTKPDHIRLPLGRVLEVLLIKTPKALWDWLETPGARIAFFLVMGLVAVALWGLTPPMEAQIPDGVSPRVEIGQVSTPTPTPEPTPNDMAKADVWVGQYVDEYFELPGQRSEARMIMHCLLKQETAHGENKGHGDQGQAGGPLQYHQPTWERMRKWMMEEGEAEKIGSRYDLEESIKTTVWIMRQSEKPSKQRKGSIAEWGPIYRALKGSNRQTCPIPSWYNKN